MSEVDVGADLLQTLESGLQAAHTLLEDVAGSAPTDVDAGLVSGLIAGMLATVLDNAGAASEALVGIATEVRGAGQDFWSVDADQVGTYTSGMAHLVD